MKKEKTYYERMKTQIKYSIIALLLTPFLTYLIIFFLKIRG